MADLVLGGCFVAIELMPSSWEILDRVRQAHHLDRSPHTWRGRLAQETGLTSTALTNAVRELVSVKILEELEIASPNGRGRPPRVLRMANEGAISIGIAIRPFQVEVAAINLSHQIVAREMVPHSMRQSEAAQADAIAEVVDAVDRLLKRLPKRPLLGIGLAASAHLSGIRGDFDEVNDFVSFSQYEKLCRVLAKKSGLGVSVRTDVDAAVLAERWASQTSESDNLFYVNDRLGCSMLCQGQPLAALGTNRWLGRFPIMPEMDPVPPKYNGCLMTQASLEAITDRLAGYEFGTRPRQSEAVYQQDYALAFARYESGDSQAVELFHRAFDLIGMAIRTLAMMFVIEWVVLEGWTATICRVAQQRVQAMLNKGVYGYPGQWRQPPQVALAQLGQDQQAVGAAIAVIEDRLKAMAGASPERV